MGFKLGLKLMYCSRFSYKKREIILDHNLGAAYMNALSPRVIFSPEGYFNNV